MAQGCRRRRWPSLVGHSSSVDSCHAVEVHDDAAFSLEIFDRYVEENGISEEDYPAVFAQWIALRTGGPAPRFEEVEQGDE